MSKLKLSKEQIYLLVRKLEKLPEQYLPDGMKGIKKSECERSEFDTFLNADLEIKKFHVLEKLALLSDLFAYWHQLYTLKQSEKLTLKKIRTKLKSTKSMKGRFRVQKIFAKPEILTVMLYVKATKTAADMLLTPDYLHSAVFYVPDHNFCLIRPLVGKENIATMKTVISVFGNLKQVRFRALDISELYNSKIKVTKLSLKVTQQIIGVPGLTELNFVGEDIKLGLEGLRKRQDVLASIGRIGPRAFIETENLCLKIGENLKARNHHSLKKISELLEIMD